MSSSNGTNRRLGSGCFSKLCSSDSRIQEIDPRLDDWEFQSLPPTQPEPIRPKSSAHANQKPLFASTLSQNPLPNIAVPSTESQGPVPRRYNKTPPPRPRTRDGTTPTTQRSSRMPTSSKRTSWGSATQTQKSPSKEPTGVEAVEGPSVSPAPSYHGTDSRNSSLRSLRQKLPPTVVDHRDSLVLDPIQRGGSGTQKRRTTMQGVQEGGSGSVSLAQPSPSLGSEGFDRYSVHHGLFDTPLTPLPSMLRSRPTIDPRASTSSELLQGIDPETSPLPRFAGPSNPSRKPSQNKARRESDFFPEGQQPIIRPR